MSKKIPRNPLKPAGTTMAFPQSNHPLAVCRPRGDRVVVLRDSVKTETPGGVLLPDSVTGASKQQLATVISVGPGTRHPMTGEIIPLDLMPGDRVIVAPYAALALEDPSAGTSPEAYAILREEDIMADLPRSSKT